MSPQHQVQDTPRSPAEPETAAAAGVTRREWIGGAAALGAALTLHPEAALAATTGPATFLAGVGKRIITPDPLLPVSGGMGPTHPTHEKKGELTARAIYLRQWNTGVAIVSLDLLGFPSVLGDRVRAHVPRL